MYEQNAAGWVIVVIGLTSSVSVNCQMKREEFDRVAADFDSYCATGLPRGARFGTSRGQYMVSFESMIYIHAPTPEKAPGLR